MDKKVEKQRASYRTMAESTKEDWEIIGTTQWVLMLIYQIEFLII